MIAFHPRVFGSLWAFTQCVFVAWALFVPSAFAASTGSKAKTVKLKQGKNRIVRAVKSSLKSKKITSRCRAPSALWPNEVLFTEHYKLIDAQVHQGGRLVSYLFSDTEDPHGQVRPDEWLLAEKCEGKLLLRVRKLSEKGRFRNIKNLSWEEIPHRDGLMPGGSEFLELISHNDDHCALCEQPHILEIKSDLSIVNHSGNLLAELGSSFQSYQYQIMRKKNSPLIVNDLSWDGTPGLCFSCTPSLPRYFIWTGSGFQNITKERSVQFEAEIAELRASLKRCLENQCEADYRFGYMLSILLLEDARGNRTAALQEFEQSLNRDYAQAARDPSHEKIILSLRQQAAENSAFRSPKNF